MDRVSRYSLLAKAAARKRPSQLFGVLSRKVRNRVVPALPVDVDERYRQRVPAALDPTFGPQATDNDRLRSSLSAAERTRYQRLATDFEDGVVTFMNRTRKLSDPAAVAPGDSALSDLPRLWFLKLAGFEPLLWGVLGNETPASRRIFCDRVDAWLESCLERERIGARRGYLRGFWTPYAVSLRSVAIARYGAWTGGVKDSVARFLYRNLLFLENNIEHDVGGNHLIENGAALVIAGTVFGEPGERFVDRGVNVLRSAAATQFLDDGYHFERSPMYHLAVTERLLSAVSVLRATGIEPPEGIRRTAADACGFIEHIRPPDGRIPLLNDAVFDQAHRLDTVARYGSAVGHSGSAPDVPGDSALRWFGTNGLSLLIDAGDSGPEQQLGHTHNDPCTILLWSDGRRLVTDTGVFDYRPGAKRSSARSIEAHNTVQVDDFEPVGYGARFRMSGAVETTTATSTRGEVTALTVEYGAANRYRHRRSVYEGGDWLVLWDDVETPVAPSVSRLHAHPAVSVNGESTVTLTHDDGPELSVTPVGVDTVNLTTSTYFPKFGVQQERVVVELCSLSGSFGYVVTNQRTDIDIERQGSTPVAIRTADRTIELPRVKI
ncbi:MULTISPECIES: alginate lyase family protein [unclassified Haloarcula]|uniref:alginate lyase family protein n=1 Tax=unclassified Haloarcula TaxID=2624677 RepID=UPI0017835386|nr:MULTISPECIES: alginate lyase family protein [unclassified Haloarcula]